MALGCERRDEPSNVAAAPIPGDAHTRVTADVKQQLAQIEVSVRTAQQEAKRDIDEARERLSALPEETRQGLSAAIDRTERARDDLSDRLDELKEATDERWDATRQRVSDAVSELAEARSEVAAALRGDTSQG
jgi:chemotaxis regulatin CheY-phosphate phosphatase CheZ